MLGNFPVLSPSGPVGTKERNLIFLAVGLCLIVVIPVFVMLVGFSIKYREGNTKAKYEPDRDHSRLLESIWWGVPGLIIAILAIVTWRSSLALDPFKPLASTQKPMTIQAIALQWKWLFIYPEQNIATVNFVLLPVDQPVKFEITSDAPMNSFWIPDLGGQIYAMSGMSTQLNLMATKEGTYHGSSANISGAGFASMDFAAVASDESKLNSSIDVISGSRDTLSESAYASLARPSVVPREFFGSVSPGLYQEVIHKYTSPTISRVGEAL